MKRLLLTIFFSILFCGQSFAEGNIIDRFATDAETTAQTRDDVGITPANISFAMATPGNIGGTTASNATFQDTIWLKDANGTHIIKSVLEPGMGSRLTIGLDEVARTFVICDAGNVDTDFGLGVATKPTLVMADDSHPSWGTAITRSNIITTQGSFGLRGRGGAYLQLAADLSSGNPFSIGPSAGNKNLTDSNNEQSYLLILPDINQTNSASWNGLKIKATITSEGNATTGDGGGTNNLILAGTSTDPDMFKVGSDGNVTIQGSLTVNGTITANDYAEHNSAFAYMSTSGTQTIDSNATFEKLDEGTIAYTAGNLENFTHSDGRLTYTGTLTKHFFATVNLSIRSGETAQTVQIRLAKNGATIAGTNMSTDFTAQTKDGCAGLNWLFSLATNDYIEIFGVSDTDGDTFDVNNMTISVMNEN